MRVAVSRYAPAFTGSRFEASRLEALRSHLDLGIEEMAAPAWDEKKHSKMVEIEVVCGALNFRDLNTIYQGLLGFRGKPATVFGSEIAGIARRVGKEVRGITVGSAVVTIAQGRCGRCFYCRGQERSGLCEVQGPGTSSGFMERAIVPAHGVRAFDPRYGFFDACAHSFSGCMAYYLIHEKLKVRPSETVVITAANSSIGVYATQTAIITGARVIALARNETLVRQCHRQQVFSAYKFDHLTSIESLCKEIRRDWKGGRIDCVLDLAADFYAQLSLDLLDHRGRYLAGGLTAEENFETKAPWRQIIEKEITVHSAGYNPTETFDRYMELLASGKAEAIIDSAFPVEQIMEACHRAWWSGERYGKVVIMFKEESACRGASLQTH